MRPGLDLRYGLLTAAYLATIYALSAVPDLTTQPQHPLVQLAFNLGHAPLFAGLAFCVFKSVSTGSNASPGRYALAFVASGVCGALDEWHQSFVRGRTASLGDLLLDLVGIGAMLLVLRFHAARKERRRATEVARLASLARFMPPPPTPLTATGRLDLRRPSVAGSKAKVSGTGTGR